MYRMTECSLVQVGAEFAGAIAKGSRCPRGILLALLHSRGVPFSPGEGRGNLAPTQSPATEN